jgi:flap endonuclease-1
MGIRGLNKLINECAPSALENKHISEFRGKKIAIDSEILIYKFRAVDNYRNSSNFQGLNKNPQDFDTNAHIIGFLMNACWYLKYGIIPVYVFDGMPSVAKKENAICKRSLQKDTLYLKIEELKNKFIEHLDSVKNDEKNIYELSPDINLLLDELSKLQRKYNSIDVTKKHRSECKYLLKLMGIPFIVANEDAEALCVALQQTGKVDYIYTEDSDALTYSAAYLCKSKQSSCKSEAFLSEQSSRNQIRILRKNTNGNQDMITVVNLNEVLNKLNLTPQAFIDMCILSGCDFCKGIPSIGPIRSYNHMKKYGSIENFIISERLTNISFFKYEDARTIFYKNHEQIIDRELNLGPFNIEDFKKYLINERYLNPTTYIDKFNYTLSLYYNLKLTEDSNPNEFKANLDP